MRVYLSFAIFTLFITAASAWGDPIIPEPGRPIPIPVPITPIEPTPIRPEPITKGFVMNVANFEQLESLRLEATDPQSRKYLNQLWTDLAENLEIYSYTLHFIFPVRPIVRLAIKGPEGSILSKITSVARDPNTPCMHTKAILPKDILHGSDSTSNEGICGVIATIHSLVDINRIRARDAYQRNRLSKKALKEFAPFQKAKAGMTFKELAQAHAHGGASTCKQLPGNGVPTNSRQGMELFWSNLNKMKNHPREDWDCTLMVRSRKKRDGTYALSHFEHVKAVRVARDNKSCEVDTTNGFNQGNGNHGRIPQNPGMNTWKFEPMGRTKGSLKTSTRPQNLRVATKEGWRNGVAFVNYVCCRVPGAPRGP